MFTGGSGIAGGAAAGIASAERAATRHLCAGTYLDRTFRNLVLSDINNKPRRRVAPSYGFDLVAVVQHAWRAWFYDVGTGLVLLTVLLTGVFADPPATVFVLCVLAAWFLLPRAVRSGLAVAHLKMRTTVDWLYRNKHNARDILALKRQGASAWAISICILALLVIAVLTLRLAAAAPGRSLQHAGEILACMAASCAIAACLRMWELRAMRNRKSLRLSSLSRRQEALDFQQRHAFVVYQRPPKKEVDDYLLPLLESDKGRPSPFVGSGRLVHRWDPPLTVQLLSVEEGIHKRPMVEREFSQPPFRVRELVDYLRSAMNRVGDPADPIRICDLACHDRIFVEETEVGPYRELLRRDVNAQDIARLIDSPHQRAHHFLEIRATDGSELMITVFARVSVKGRTLSLDFAASALTRTRDDFHVPDGVGENGFSATLRAAFRALLSVPESAWQLWQLFRLPFVAGKAVWSAGDRMTVPRRGVTIGSASGLRQDHAVLWEQAQFDQIVISDLIKVMESRLVRATQDFLASRGVDTSELDKQATNIINSGVLNMGGSIEVRDSAIGSNSQLHQMAIQVAGYAQEMSK